MFSNFNLRAIDQDLKRAIRLAIEKKSVRQDMLARAWGIPATTLNGYFAESSLSPIPAAVFVAFCRDVLDFTPMETLVQLCTETDCDATYCDITEVVEATKRARAAAAITLDRLLEAIADGTVTEHEHDAYQAARAAEIAAERIQDMCVERCYRNRDLRTTKRERF